MLFRHLLIGDTFSFTSSERPGHRLDIPEMEGPWVKASNYLFVHKSDEKAIIFPFEGIRYYQALFQEGVSKC